MIDTSPPCVYKHLDDGIHHFHLNVVSTVAVDQFFEKLLEIAVAHGDKTLPVRLLVTGPGDIPSLPYLRSHVISLEKNVGYKMAIKVAFVLEKATMEFLVNAMFQVVSRNRNNASRIFKQKDYDKALAWLREGD